MPTTKTTLTPFQQRRAKQQADAVSRGLKPSTGSRRKFAPEVARERHLERTRRVMDARRRAYTMLADKYQDEFKALYVVELAGVNQERGPLPGDEA